MGLWPGPRLAWSGPRTCLSVAGARQSFFYERLALRTRVLVILESRQLFAPVTGSDRLRHAPIMSQQIVRLRKVLLWTPRAKFGFPRAGAHGVFFPRVGGEVQPDSRRIQFSSTDSPCLCLCLGLACTHHYSCLQIPNGQIKRENTIYIIL